MELGETVRQGAERETLEEAGAQIEMLGLHTILSVPVVGQVHLFYRAKLLSEIFDPGHETVRVQLFSEEEIPWDDMAFTTGKIALKHFLEDAKIGSFTMLERDLV